jgi:hypothetical protein
LREFGSQLSDDQELRECGRTIRKGRVGSATEILKVTKSCRRKWLCPTCGYVAFRKQSAKLRSRLRGWTAQGHAVALLTLTHHHRADDRLAALWDRSEDGWAALVRGSGWTTDKQAHGIRGYIRITEVVHSATGWNVHFHVILLLDRQLDQPRLNDLRASVTTRFARGVAGRGGRAMPRCQDLRPMKPGTEMSLATYLFKGTTIDRSKDGSRTPIAILDDLESTGEGHAIWDELTAAVTATRRMQLITSTGVGSLCTPGHRDPDSTGVKYRKVTERQQD